jgi:radical SAM superfamily enzyme YgiQ (UPF0313 family)
MRVLLLSAANDAGSMTPLPLGLACVAQAAEASGHEVHLLNMSADANWEKGVRHAVEQFSPEVIGLSVRNIDDQNMQSPRFLLETLKSVVSACRKHSSVPVVLGGAGYSIFPASALEYLGADFGIGGEGEGAFPALLSWLQHERQAAAPPSTYFPNALQTPAEFNRDLDSFPMPEPRLWLDFPGSQEQRIPVQTRRGCPLDCSYCSTSAIEGRPVRLRSADSVVRWLAMLREKGFRHVHFVDNTFNLPPHYAKELCRKLIEAELGLEWWAIIYPKWVDATLAELMAKAGCSLVSLGFESGSDAILPQLNKHFTCVEVREISKALAAVGIKRNGFLLLGGPQETRETVEESLEFAEGLQLDALKITAGIRIYPSTRLASVAIAEGLIRPEDSLLFPRFYMAQAVRDWLPERVAGCSFGDVLPSTRS